MAAADRQPHRVLLGALYIACLVAFGALIFALDDIRQAFAQRYTLVAVFPKAPDLNVDAHVLIAGRYAGRVTDVALQPIRDDTITRVNVTLRLSRRYQEQVRQDSYATLASVTLIGERVVDITPGSPALPVLVDGDTLAVHLPEPMAELMARVDDARAALDALQEAAAALRAPLTARRRAFEPARRELDAAQREFAQLRQAMDAGPGSAVLRDPELRAAIARVGNYMSEIGPAFAAATGAAEGAGQELRTAIAELMQSFDELSADIAALQARADDTDGFIGRLAHDTAIHVAVRETQLEVDSLIAAVRRNPFRYFRLRLW
jgi:phospholipid/cholesterol/gamma-HCH transport system substrate-binding protein